MKTYNEQLGQLFTEWDAYDPTASAQRARTGEVARMIAIQHQSTKGNYDKRGSKTESQGA